MGQTIKTVFTRFFGAFVSGKRAAYTAMFIMLVAPFTSFVDRLLAPLFLRVPNSYKTPPCLMIVASSRSGATIVNQVLTRELNCVYISNMHILFPNFGSAILSMLNMWGKGSMKHKNYYGYTASLFDVNEANDIVKRLISVNLSKQQRAELFRNFSYRMGATSERPLVFKNVRHFEKLSLLIDAIPEITFTHVYRKPQFAAQSVLRAYYELGYYHPVPNTLVKDQSEPVEFSVKQVFEVNRIIHEQIKLAGEGKYFNVRYEDFCEDYQSFIDRFCSDLNFSIRIENQSDRSYELVASQKVNIDKVEFERISALVQQYQLQSSTDLY
jgi:hypothetical protein